MGSFGGGRDDELYRGDAPVSAPPRPAPGEPPAPPAPAAPAPAKGNRLAARDCLLVVILVVLVVIGGLGLATFTLLRSASSGPAEAGPDVKPVMIRTGDAKLAVSVTGASAE